MIPVIFDYVRAESIDQAIQQLKDSDGEGKIIAGGHSLLPLLKMRLTEPKVLIDISGIDALKEVRKDGDRLIVGAMKTHREVSIHPEIKKHIPLLSETARQIGDIQIRNKGTIGGNIAHADPAADYPAAAFTLDAKVLMTSENGEESMDIDSFIIGPLITMMPEESIVTGISFQIPPTHTKSVYLKYSHHASGYPVVGVAVVVGTDSNGAIDFVRVGITGAGDLAYRATAVEEELIGKTPSEAVIKEASKLAAVDGEMGSDLFASPEYRENLCKVYTERALTSVLL